MLQCTVTACGDNGFQKNLRETHPKTATIFFTVFIEKRKHIQSINEPYIK